MKEDVLFLYQLGAAQFTEDLLENRFGFFQRLPVAIGCTRLVLWITLSACALLDCFGMGRGALSFISNSPSVAPCAIIASSIRIAL